MTDLENPFSGKPKSMREIADEKNAQSLRLLLGVCRTAKQTLESVRRSAPNSSMPAHWQAKLDAARAEFVTFAQQLGVARSDAEVELARELGEEIKTPRDADDECESS